MQRKIILLALLSVFSGTLSAEFLTNPDPNTLWIEDGKDIQVAPQALGRAWESSNLSIEAAPDGNGFSVTAVDPKKYSTMRYVPLNPEYPWLVYEITGVEQQKGYLGYSFYFPGSNTIGQVTAASKGIFAVKIFDNKPFPARNQIAFRLDLYGQALTFAYWKMVKEPENYITVESAAFQDKNSFSSGDTLQFRVTLEKPAEDVTLRLVNPYMMKPLQLNQKGAIQLKPVNQECTVWGAEEKVDSLVGEMMERMNKVLIRATVLGGGIQEPLWGAIMYPWKNEQ